MILMYVLHVSVASITKEHVVSIWYLLCSKHIDLFHKEETSMGNQHIFEDAFGKGLESGFWSHLRWILEAFDLAPRFHPSYYFSEGHASPIPAQQVIFSARLNDFLKQVRWSLQKSYDIET